MAFSYIFQCFSIFFTLMVCRLQGMSIEKNELPLEPFELDEFINGTFQANGWGGEWISDDAFVYRNTTGDILRYDLQKKSAEILLEAAVLEKYSGCEVTISPDQSYALIQFDKSAVFRHSTTALFTVYDIANKKYYDIANLTPLQLVKFAPTGHGLVYVLENNIYYLEDFSMDVQNPITVTTEGRKGVVYCGVPDWVYEEEVLASGSALWFSPGATHIAYAKFDDKNVKDFTYFTYGQPGSMQNQYPTEVQIKYPKVGTPNPIVSVYIYEIAMGMNIELELPPTSSIQNPNDYILYDLTWISDYEVAMISTNRIQNQSAIVRCFINGTCHEESFSTAENGWLEPKIPIYSRDGRRKVELLPQVEGNDKFDHIVLTNVEIGIKKRLTNGRRVVLSILGWNEIEELIYFTSTVVDEPSQQHVYVVDEQGNESCLSCDMTIEGTNCSYADASFSKSNSYFLKTCLGPKPSYYVIQNSRNSSDMLIWEDNDSLRKELSKKMFPVIKNLEVPLKDNLTARVRLFLPPDLNENSFEQYPALVNTYGGPNSNQIGDSFGVSLQYYLTTKKGYIYILIDGRGSGRDGQNKMFKMYKNFGTVEIEDQIAVTMYLQKNLPYIDPTRTGIWGWSYGGFASSWVLAKDTKHVFKFALAVAPVTSFIYYDSIYTERYMGLPTEEDNQIGYNNSDLTRVVENFRGRNYFIIHGNADDNVHYQNSMVFVKALETADVVFRQQSYPDENHSLGGVRRHLYHTIDRYLESQFSIQ
ncbi:unnamed protein product [Phaedon cochleariae]|uniref:Venom dipeptidyl peptidase 4 n=1 Tax=Phaedon cochleariae TaxID=80249 RepID=A0A9P0DV44_PHACE|nr:unnamed protein product [Phaedon cochleariae]